MPEQTIFTLSNVTGPDENGLRHGVAAAGNVLRSGWYERRHDWRKEMSYDRFYKNPILTVDHSYDVEDIIGRVASHSINSAGLNIAMEFHGETEKSRIVASMWDKGYVSGLSISYGANKEEFEYDEEEDKLVHTLAESELVHMSVVSVPRDEDTLKNSLLTSNNLHLLTRWENMRGNKNKSEEQIVEALICSVCKNTEEDSNMAALLENAMANIQEETI